jgi:hypothetical protein
VEEFDGDIERLWAELSIWAGDQRADEAASGRAREAWLRRQAEDAASLVGVLVDLAERRADVVIHLAAAGEHTVRGTIDAVGTDFVAVMQPAGPTSLIAIGAVGGVRSLGSLAAVEATGDRLAPLRTGLVDALALLAGDRAAVRLVLVPSGQSVAGQLRSVGTDVVTVRLDTVPPSTIVVALGAVGLCQLR